MFKMIVAHTKDRGIGFRGRLPWSLKDDMLRFKRLTIGDNNNAVVMGKNTWLSLSKRPLQKRDNLILSKSISFDYKKHWCKDLDHNNVKVFPEIIDLKKYCRERGYDDIWIIGGENIYTQFMKDPELKYIYTTEIDHIPFTHCDAYFPDIPSWFKRYWTSKKVLNKNTSYLYSVFSRPI